MSASAELEARLGELAGHPSRGARQINKAVRVDLTARGLNQAQIAEFFGVSGAAWHSGKKSRRSVRPRISRPAARL